MMDEFNINFTYENALRALENRISEESRFPSLMEQLKVQSNAISVSGLKDGDYPVLNELVGGNVKATKTSTIPYILQEKTRETQQNCMMGVFTEIDRLWVTVDSQLFLWNYEISGDPEYYSDFSDTIMAVSLIKPKGGIFNNSINYLLCLSGQTETKILGVTISGFQNNIVEFCKEPLFTISTDEEQINIIESLNGRIFLGSKSGSVLELIYWSEKPGWFNLSRHSIPTTSQYSFESGNKIYMKIVNHSSWKLSILLPNILVNGFINKESIIQIASDQTRNMIYTLSENSLIAQYELLPNDSLTRINYITESSISSKITRAVSFIEKQQFKNIVSISPLSIGYGSLKLVAITQNGIRLYFTDNLKLCHIRLPPVSSSGMYGKLNNVQVCCESRGSFLLICGSSIDSQALYTINPDTFLSHYELLETVSVTWNNPGSICYALLPLDQQQHNLLAGSPVIQTQHLDSARRFLMITRDSIIQLELPSPIKYLRTILEATINQPCNNNTSSNITFNPQSLEIRTWINHFGLDETIYAALLLCVQHKSVTSTNVSTTLSTRALELVLYYLNESVNVRLHNIQNNNMKYECANPLHQLLCTYMARIMRPLWDSCILEVSKTNKNEFFSTHDFDQLGWYIGHLVYLHDFIRDTYPRIKSIDTLQFPSVVSSLINVGPLALELLELLKVAIEVVGLWKVLNEHQFHLIINHLSEDLRHELLNCSVKHLLLPSKRYVLTGLIYALLEYYLADCASTESIIEILLKVCPNIFRYEDALCSRANELIVMADMLSIDPKEDPETVNQKRDDMLIEAVNFYEQIGPQIDLSSVIYRLRTVNCNWGAVHLCLHTAKLRDPEEIAFICLRESRRPQTSVEINCVEGRNDAYKYMLECLSSLLDCDKQNLHLSQTINSTNVTSLLDSSVRMSHHNTSLSNGDSRRDNLIFVSDPYKSTSGQGNDLKVILTSIFSNKDDIMAHYEVYSWMIDNDLSNYILKYPTNHLESFLQQTVQNQPQSSEIKMLLSKYLETQCRYFEAAKVLDNMAVSESTELNLDERITCLSRAIVFLKAAIGEKQFSDLDFLKDLEDKVEIANLQKVIIDEVDTANTTIVAELNSRLFSIYNLLKDYVEPLELTISKLYILKVSNQNDIGNIRMVWEEVLEKEIFKAEQMMSMELKMSSLKHGVGHIVSRFKDNMTYVPLEFIIYQLECYSELNNISPDFTVNCLIAADISISRILMAYHDVIKMKNHDLKKCFRRIFESISYCLEMMLHKEINTNECTPFIGQILDLISNSLIQLQSKSDSSNDMSTIDKFKAYKSLIEQRVI